MALQIWIKKVKGVLRLNSVAKEAPKHLNRHTLLILTAIGPLFSFFFSSRLTLRMCNRFASKWRKARNEANYKIGWECKRTRVPFASGLHKGHEPCHTRTHRMICIVISTSEQRQNHHIKAINNKGKINWKVENAPSPLFFIQQVFMNFLGKLHNSWAQKSYTLATYYVQIAAKPMQQKESEMTLTAKP